MIDIRLRRKKIFFWSRKKRERKKSFYNKISFLTLKGRKTCVSNLWNISETGELTKAKMTTFVSLMTIYRFKWFLYINFLLIFGLNLLFSYLKKLTITIICFNPVASAQLLGMVFFFQIYSQTPLTRTHLTRNPA